MVSTAQNTSGAGSLNNIVGTLSTDADIDMYCIRIVDEASFYARNSCLAFADPDLWLFTPSSMGVTHNESC